MTTPVDDTVLGRELMSTRLVCIDGMGSPSSPILATIYFLGDKAGREPAPKKDSRRH